jgi:hypothetical protein
MQQFEFSSNAALTQFEKGNFSIKTKTFTLYQELGDICLDMFYKCINIKKSA